MVASSTREFLDAPRDAKTVSFLDASALGSLERLAKELAAPADQMSPPELRRLHAAVSLGPVIAICEDSFATAAEWLPEHPWLSHVMSASLLEHPIAKVHLRNLMTTLGSAGERNLVDWLRPKGAGRRIRLTHASRRLDRLDRMSEFFKMHGLASSAITTLRDMADELLVNAFYEGPVAAGAEAKPISRSRDVALPDEYACDLVYGSTDELAVVRVRDPFGALTRAKIVDTLSRSARAKLSGEPSSTGLWRVCSAAAIVAVSVVKGRHTEVLVAIPMVDHASHPFAMHMFFRDGAQRGMWRLVDEDTGQPSLSKSVTVTVIPV